MTNELADAAADQRGKADAGMGQIFLWRLVPEASASQIVATLAGGPVGIVAAMYLHPRMMRRKS